MGACTSSKVKLLTLKQTTESAQAHTRGNRKDPASPFGTHRFTHRDLSQATSPPSEQSNATSELIRCKPPSGLTSSSGGKLPSFPTAVSTGASDIGVSPSRQLLHLNSSSSHLGTAIPQKLARGTSERSATPQTDASASLAQKNCEAEAATSSGVDPARVSTRSTTLDVVDWIDGNDKTRLSTKTLKLVSYEEVVRLSQALQEFLTEVRCGTRDGTKNDHEQFREGMWERLLGPTTQTEWHQPTLTRDGRRSLLLKLYRNAMELVGEQLIFGNRKKQQQSKEQEENTHDIITSVYPWNTHRRQYAFALYLAEKYLLETSEHFMSAMRSNSGDVGRNSSMRCLKVLPSYIETEELLDVPVTQGGLDGVSLLPPTEEGVVTLISSKPDDTSAAVICRTPEVEPLCGGLLWKKVVNPGEGWRRPTSRCIVYITYARTASVLENRKCALPKSISQQWNKLTLVLDPSTSYSNSALKALFDVDVSEEKTTLLKILYEQCTESGIGFEPATVLAVILPGILDSFRLAAKTMRKGEVCLLWSPFFNLLVDKTSSTLDTRSTYNGPRSGCVPAYYLRLESWKFLTSVATEAEGSHAVFALNEYYRTCSPTKGVDLKPMRMEDEVILNCHVRYSVAGGELQFARGRRGFNLLCETLPDKTLETVKESSSQADCQLTRQSWILKELPMEVRTALTYMTESSVAALYLRWTPKTFQKFPFWLQLTSPIASQTKTFKTNILLTLRLLNLRSHSSQDSVETGTEDAACTKPLLQVLALLRPHLATEQISIFEAYAGCLKYALDPYISAASALCSLDDQFLQTIHACQRVVFEDHHSFRKLEAELVKNKGLVSIPLSDSNQLHFWKCQQKQLFEEFKSCSPYLCVVDAAFSPSFAVFAPIPESWCSVTVCAAIRRCLWSMSTTPSPWRETVSFPLRDQLELFLSFFDASLSFFRSNQSHNWAVDRLPPFISIADPHPVTVRTLEVSWDKTMLLSTPSPMSPSEATPSHNHSAGPTFAPSRFYRSFVSKARRVLPTVDNTGFSPIALGILPMTVLLADAVYDGNPLVSLLASLYICSTVRHLRPIKETQQSEKRKALVYFWRQRRQLELGESMVSKEFDASSTLASLLADRQEVSSAQVSTDAEDSNAAEPQRGLAYVDPPVKRYLKIAHQTVVSFIANEDLLLIVDPFASAATLESLEPSKILQWADTTLGNLILQDRMVSLNVASCVNDSATLAKALQSNCAAMLLQQFRCFNAMLSVALKPGGLFGPELRLWALFSAAETCNEAWRLQWYLALELVAKALFYARRLLVQDLKSVSFTIDNVDKAVDWLFSLPLEPTQHAFLSQKGNPLGSAVLLILALTYDQFCTVVYTNTASSKTKETVVLAVKSVLDKTRNCPRLIVAYFLRSALNFCTFSLTAEKTQWDDRQENQLPRPFPCINFFDSLLSFHFTSLDMSMDCIYKWSSKILGSRNVSYSACLCVKKQNLEPLLSPPLTPLFSKEASADHESLDEFHGAHQLAASTLEDNCCNSFSWRSRLVRLGRLLLKLRLAITKFHYGFDGLHSGLVSLAAKLCLSLTADCLSLLLQFDSWCGDQFAGSPCISEREPSVISQNQERDTSFTAWASLLKSSVLGLWLEIYRLIPLIYDVVSDVYNVYSGVVNLTSGDWKKTLERWRLVSILSMMGRAHFRLIAYGDITAFKDLGASAFKEVYKYFMPFVQWSPTEAIHFSSSSLCLTTARKKPFLLPILKRFHTSYMKYDVGVVPKTRRVCTTPLAINSDILYHPLVICSTYFLLLAAYADNDSLDVVNKYSSALRQARLQYPLSPFDSKPPFAAPTDLTSSVGQWPPVGFRAYLYSLYVMSRRSSAGGQGSSSACDSTACPTPFDAEAYNNQLTSAAMATRMSALTDISTEGEPWFSRLGSRVLHDVPLGTFLQRRLECVQATLDENSKTLEQPWRAAEVVLWNLSNLLPDCFLWFELFLLPSVLASSLFSTNITLPSNMGVPFSEKLMNLKVQCQAPQPEPSKVTSLSSRSITFRTFTFGTNSIAGALGVGLPSFIRHDPSLYDVIPEYRSENVLLATRGTDVWWSSQPLAIACPSTSHFHIKAVACGDHHTLALTVSGTLCAWGCNKYGQCGTPVTFRSMTSDPLKQDDSYSANERLAADIPRWTSNMFHQLLLLLLKDPEGGTSSNIGLSIVHYNSCMNHIQHLLAEMRTYHGDDHVNDGQDTFPLCATRNTFPPILGHETSSNPSSQYLSHASFFASSHCEKKEDRYHADFLLPTCLTLPTEILYFWKPSECYTGTTNIPLSNLCFDTIAAGAAFSVARATSGHLFLWGHAGDGCLGQGLLSGIISEPSDTGQDEAFSHSYNFRPTQLMGCRVAELFAFAVDRLNPSPTLPYPDGVLKNYFVSRLHKIAQVACGAMHVAVVDGYGGLWCWGQGEAGQLGLPLKILEHASTSSPLTSAIKTRRRLKDSTFTHAKSSYHQDSTSVKPHVRGSVISFPHRLHVFCSVIKQPRKEDPCTSNVSCAAIRANVTELLSELRLPRTEKLLQNITCRRNASGEILVTTITDTTLLFAEREDAYSRAFSDGPVQAAASEIFFSHVACGEGHTLALGKLRREPSHASHTSSGRQLDGDCLFAWGQCGYGQLGIALNDNPTATQALNLCQFWRHRTSSRDFEDVFDELEVPTVRSTPCLVNWQPLDSVRRSASQYNGNLDSRCRQIHNDFHVETRGSAPPERVTIVGLRAGGCSSAAILGNGGLLVWGGNDFGMLGFPEDRWHEIPQPRQLPLDLKTFGAVKDVVFSKGAQRMFILSSFGLCLCLGRDAFGASGRYIRAQPKLTKPPCRYFHEQRSPPSRLELPGACETSNYAESEGCPPPSFESRLRQHVPMPLKIITLASGAAHTVAVCPSENYLVDVSKLFIPDGVQHEGEPLSSSKKTTHFSRALLSGQTTDNSHHKPPTCLHERANTQQLSSIRNVSFLIASSFSSSASPRSSYEFSAEAARKPLFHCHQQSGEVYITRKPADTTMAETDSYNSAVTERPTALENCIATTDCKKNYAAWGLLSQAQSTSSKPTANGHTFQGDHFLSSKAVRIGDKKATPDSLPPPSSVYPAVSHPLPVCPTRNTTTNQSDDSLSNIEYENAPLAVGLQALGHLLYQDVVKRVVRLGQSLARASFPPASHESFHLSVEHKITQDPFYAKEPLKHDLHEKGYQAREGHHTLGERRETLTLPKPWYRLDASKLDWKKSASMINPRITPPYNSTHAPPYCAQASLPPHSSISSPVSTQPPTALGDWPGTVSRASELRYHPNDHESFWATARRDATHYSVQSLNIRRPPQACPPKPPLPSSRYMGSGCPAVRNPVESAVSLPSLSSFSSRLASRPLNSYNRQLCLGTQLADSSSVERRLPPSPQAVTPPPKYQLLPSETAVLPSLSHRPHCRSVSFEGYQRIHTPSQSDVLAPELLRSNLKQERLNPPTMIYLQNTDSAPFSKERPSSGSFVPLTTSPTKRITGRFDTCRDPRRAPR